MNSLIRLVGEDLQSTPATDLAHKKAIILDTTGSNRELKEMDLSEPTFGDVSCARISASSVETIAATASTVNATDVSCQALVSHGPILAVDKVILAGYAKLEINRTSVNWGTVTQNKIIFQNNGWNSGTGCTGTITGRLRQLTLKYAGEGYIQFYSSSSNVDFPQTGGFVRYIPIKYSETLKGDGDEYTEYIKYYKRNGEDISSNVVQITLSIANLLTENVYNGTIYIYLIQHADT